MDNLSDELKIELLTYLDIFTILNMSSLNKSFHSLFQSPNFWNLKKQSVQKPLPLTLGAYFSYDPKQYFSSLFTHESFDFSAQVYQDLLYRLANPRPLIMSQLESRLNQSLTGMLKYEDDMFWNSKQRAESESSEFIVCELVDLSLIFFIHFKVYRAVWQGGTLFPSNFMRIHIGESEESYHYSSPVFKVPMTEKYCTVHVLPEIVFGRFVKVELIGKVTLMPNTNLYIAALDFLEIVGSTMTDCPENKLETQIKNKEIDKVAEILNRNKQKATPFVVDLMERCGILDQVLKKITRAYNEAESFVFVKERVHMMIDMNNIKPSEALGDYCFEKGAFSKAFFNYSKIMDVWKLMKTAIVLKHGETIKLILNKHEPRYPRFADILTIASSLGQEFEDYVLTLG